MHQNYEILMTEVRVKPGVVVSDLPFERSSSIFWLDSNYYYTTTLGNSIGKNNTYVGGLTI